MQTGEDRIGELITDPARRGSWREIVFALHQASLPGGPLEGWAFHGTDGECAGSICDEGMGFTEAWVVCGPDEHKQIEGTHWATPKVAAFYAEDRIESLEDDTIDLVLVAIPVRTLEKLGVLYPDANTIEYPISSRLGRTEADLWSAWNASEQDALASWSIYGTVVSDALILPEDMVFVENMNDVHALIERAMNYGMAKRLNTL